MGTVDPLAARWSGVPAGRGHYESYYVRAVHPSEPLGLWIRYTVLIAPGREPVGQLWCTVFDRSAPGPRAIRAEAGPVSSGEGTCIRLGESSFGAAEVRGRISLPSGSARWSLRATPVERPLLHFARGWMYSGRLPRTKPTSPAPVAVLDGTLEFDGKTMEVDGWAGMIGHNWGEQHAQQWIWLHGLGFEGRGADTWLDVAVGRVRLGRWVTPWVANGALSLDGERMPLGGLGQRIAVTTSSDRCEARIPGRKLTMTVSASAPEEAFVAWDYANPDGAMHRVRNCSVADLTARVERTGHEPIELTAAGRAAYELGRPNGDQG